MLDGIITHALRASPAECVGFLLGEGISDYLPLRNVSPRPRQSFALDPLEVASAMSLRLPVVGLYHSHPDGCAWPSSTDACVYLASGWHYWIVAGGTLFRAVVA